MSEAPQKSRSWAGIVVSAIPTLFLLLDAIGKLVKPEAVVTGTIELGYPESVIVPLGIILLICTVLYAIPKTSVIGAILLTGYLGGAVATHVRLNNPLFTHQLFPVYLGIMIWLGLYLRSSNKRHYLPATFGARIQRVARPGIRGLV